MQNNPLLYTDPSGLAYFAKRPLDGIPGSLAKEIGTNPFDDYANTELVHEQIFYEDGKVPSNQGFFGDNGAWNKPGVVRPDEAEKLNQYWRSDSKTYDDLIMRDAVKNVGPGNYCLLGENCQDWANKVRQEYQRLENQNICQ